MLLFYAIRHNNETRNKYEEMSEEELLAKEEQPKIKKYISIKEVLHELLRALRVSIFNLKPIPKNFAIWFVSITNGRYGGSSTPDLWAIWFVSIMNGRYGSSSTPDFWAIWFVSIMNSRYGSSSTPDLWGSSASS
ncbi:36880_t:CDS:2 [Racocetra persica]|uniref:36880_t:CDS:1 n=1 Tax=Racocetra persica TaxID=160502 RepID=A0ACA9MAK3_9GLOM|nr:36880_t:CDS:2 [Racocetra persica]